ncbi:MAG: DUF3857 domain-containing protein [Pyrinomonadaceae bacterium]|nr:DUF3857 domain-containing protein [Pyrinomonadaceae bacterium]MBP6211477.1 DUF3857 domain-containing protein [Pyrinomonadaceae bacterium]
MSDVSRCHRVYFNLIFFAITLLASVGVPAQDGDWRPVTNPELQMKVGKIDPAADAEIIFWDMKIDDSSRYEIVNEYYVRVKVFTDRGVQQFSTIDLAFSGSSVVKDVQARVINPDGTIRLIRNADILTRKISEEAGKKKKAKYFTVTDLGVGSIVEYRYKYVRQGKLKYARAQLQFNEPVHEVKVRIIPFQDSEMAANSFNTTVPMQRERDKSYTITQSNVPAFVTEPMMPPRDEVLRWVHVQYRNARRSDKTTYWYEFSKLYFDYGNEILKVNDELRTKAASIVAGASSVEDKVKRIYDFCRTNIKNVTGDETATAAEIKIAEKFRTPAKVLASGVGDGGDVNLLFAALVRAAGLDARYFLIGDRNEHFFNSDITDFDLMLGEFAITVNINGSWRIFSPGLRYFPFGSIGWWVEGQTGLVSDNNQLIWVRPVISEPEQSNTKRTGRFTLDMDGTLEGSVVVEYTGHSGRSMKYSYDEDTVAGREESLRATIQQTIKPAEISSLRVENATDPDKPFTVRYNIRFPNYAQRLGARFLFQPGYFEYGSKPVFTSAERRYEVYFKTPWSEDDDIEIVIPAGLEPENLETPAKIADSRQVGLLETNMTFDRARSVLSYKRKFEFGRNGMILFPPAAYPAIKTLFDAFHQANTYSISFRAKK